MVCGLTVVIPGENGPFGIFGTHHDRTPSEFIDEAVESLSGFPTQLDALLEEAAGGKVATELQPDDVRILELKKNSVGA